jgi:hypothetical protein
VAQDRGRHCQRSKASTDCGGGRNVEEEIVHWTKLKVLKQGEVHDDDDDYSYPPPHLADVLVMEMRAFPSAEFSHHLHV